MFEYKKVLYHFTRSNLMTKKIEESLEDLFDQIEKEAIDGWRFVQAIHPYPTNTVCLLIFERERR